MTTIQELATIACDHVESATRDNRETFLKFDDTSPAWIQELCFAAHDAGDMLPDDWRYRFITDALHLIAEHGDFNGAENAIETDVYTHNLLQWVSSNLSRMNYVDQAQDDYGLEAKTDMFKRLSWGQYAERIEVFGAVWSFLEGMADESEES